MIGVIHLLLQKGYSDILVLFDCLEFNDMWTFEILIEKVKFKKSKDLKLSAIKAMNKYFEDGKCSFPPIYYAIINKNTELLDFFFDNFSSKDIIKMLEYTIDDETVFSAIFKRCIKIESDSDNQVKVQGKSLILRTYLDIKALENIHPELSNLMPTMQCAMKLNLEQVYVPISLKFNETDLIHPLALFLTTCCDIKLYTNIIQMFGFDSDKPKIRENRDFFISQILTNLKIVDYPYFKHHVAAFLKNKKNKNVIKSVFEKWQCTKRVYDYFEQNFKFTLKYHEEIEYATNNIVTKHKASKKLTPDYIKDSEVTIKDIVNTAKEEQK